MKLDYTAKRKLALKLITKFGQDGEFIKIGSPAGVDSRRNPVAAVDDVVISGIVTPLLKYSNAEIDGEMIQRGDGFVFFHSDVSPEIGYTVTINSSLYRVISIESLTSVDDINVYRKIQLRK